jgi:hypothetical protein
MFFERLAEAKVGVGVSRRRSAPEVHQEIQVAFRRPATPGGGPKELLTLHAIAAAVLISALCSAILAVTAYSLLQTR